MDGARPTLAPEEEIIREGYPIYILTSSSSFTPLRQHSLGRRPTATFVTIGGQVGQDTYRNYGLPRPLGTAGHYIVVIAPPALALREGQTPAEVPLISYVYPVDSRRLVIPTSRDPARLSRRLQSRFLT
jgi:hypothetical protein